MLGLRQQIRRDKHRLSTHISHDQYFRRTGRHIDRHQSIDLILDEHLGGRHILVARTDNLIDLGHTLCTVRHRTHSLCTTSTHYACRLDLVGNVQHFWRNRAV